MTESDRPLRAVLLESIVVNGTWHHKGEVYDIGSVEPHSYRGTMVELKFGTGLLAVPPCKILVLAPESKKETRQRRLKIKKHHKPNLKTAFMAIKGKIIATLPEVSGVSKAGKTWRKKGYVLETEGAYPKKVFFVVMGDNISKFALVEGNTYEVEVDIESREYEGKWYHSVTAWRVNPQQNERT